MTAYEVISAKVSEAQAAVDATDRTLISRDEVNLLLEQVEGLVAMLRDIHEPHEARDYVATVK